MKCAVVLNNGTANHAERQVGINGVNLTVDLLEVDTPTFDPLMQPDLVWIRIKGFSCNYRDKALMLMAAQGEKAGYYVIGSEFVGEVIAVGTNVNTLKPGDRVIGNNSWPNTLDGQLGGVPTNHASKEYQAFRPTQLVRIPDQMPNADAAAFSIGAQTIYSMIRKLNLPDGARVLVTAAKSNTALFAIKALQQRNVEIYAVSTSDRFGEHLRELGVTQVFVVDLTQNLYEQIGHSFDYIIDPFSDIYLPRLNSVLGWDATYITCGSQVQGRVSNMPQDNLWDTMSTIMLKNISLIGNCLGTSDDLIHALEDYTTGSFRPIIDSVFTAEQVIDFIDRTYNAPDRFGKVVLLY